MKKYMKLLTEKIETTITSALPSKFGIIFDGWSEGSDHYIALFACYNLKGEVRTPLLSNANGYQLTAEAHKQFIFETLNFYEKESDSLIFLVGDNCATNTSLATKCGVPLIGCGSHRLNLAVKKFLEPHEPVLKKIHELMSKLSTIKQAAKLRRSTNLQPIKRNVTRWSSTFAMIMRFFELEQYLRLNIDTELFPLFPTKSEEEDLGKIVMHLKDFESVSKKLQETGVDLLVQRKLSDALISKFPVTYECLGPNSRLVHTPTFESAICKVIQGTENLDMYEEVALQRFLNQEEEEEEAEEGVSFVDHVLKKPRLNLYPDLSYIPPTSNLAERFFSGASFVMTDLRKSTLPKNLEIIMYLKFNREWWNPKLLAEVYKEESR